MMKSTLAVIGLITVVGFAYGSEPNSNITRILQVPGAQELVVVAEGEFEPRGVGSYTLRVYGRARTEFPLDEFIAGAIRRRNGAIEKVLFENLDRDDTIAIVVVIRSVGSGGYLSADGFRYRA
jgi:Periplasmic lysozyme inhibitor of I-type lysozyme